MIKTSQYIFIQIRNRPSKKVQEILGWPKNSFLPYFERVPGCSGTNTPLKGYEEGKEYITRFGG
jgi:hypothetical protein